MNPNSSPDPADDNPPGAVVPVSGPTQPAATPSPAPTPTVGADARNRRTVLILAFIGAGVLLTFFAFFFAVFNHRPAVAQRAAQVRGSDAPPLLQKPVSMEVAGFSAARGRGEAPAPTPTPPPARPTATATAPEFLPPAPVPAAFSVSARRSGGSAGGGRVTAPRSAPVRGVVPGFQVIPCKLVGALENSGKASRPAGNGLGGGNNAGDGGENGATGQSTSVKAVVDEDIRTWDTHEVIIPKGTLCNAVGHFERARDRILVDTLFTFILPDRGPGHMPLELVIPGIAQDREYDAQVDHWSVTDLSDGIRGDYIQTRNLDELRFFAYKFISGASGALSSVSAGSFGQSFNNGSSSGASGLPGFVINPAVGGSQAVLDREAERIAAKIENDGYFLRVPAHKQFYVLVTRGFSMRDAKNPVEAHALREQSEDDRLRRRDERRARERAAEGGGPATTNQFGGVPAFNVNDPSLAALLNPNAPSTNGLLRRPPPLPAPSAAPAGSTLRFNRPDPAAATTADTDPLPTN